MSMIPAGPRWLIARLTVITTVVALVLTAVAAGVLALAGLHTDLRQPYSKEGLLVILVLGSDGGPPHRPRDAPMRSRADGIHLVAVDTQQRRATIVNIPRDTLAGGTKINAHLVFGGPEAMVAQVEALTGVAIDFYAATTFLGIEQMTDGLGGVDIVLERPMVDPFSESNFPEAGPRTVNGPEALAYVRNRQSMPDGDFGRTRNQGNFMRFVHHQIVDRNSDLLTLTRLAALFARNTVTDIPADQLLPMALLAVQIPPDQVHQVPLSGGFGTTAGGASIVHLRPGDAFERIRAGQVGPP